MVADAAEWLRVRLELKADVVRISNKVRYGLLAAALILERRHGHGRLRGGEPAGTGSGVIVFGTGLAALSAASAVFALDLALMKHGWCGHLCPLGAFWSLVGRLTRSSPCASALTTQLATAAATACAPVPNPTSSASPA
ncbi:MAG: 4Fe-4S binding protein [Sutterella wadsworthensis]